MGASPPQYHSQLGSNLNGAMAGGTLNAADGTPLPVRNPSSKFKGIRDLEEKDPSEVTAASVQFRKEGLLWSLSRPGGHMDPKGLTKTAWHK